MAITTVFERENFLQLPDSLCQQWGLTDDHDLYASIHDGDISLTKERRKNTVAVVGVFLGRGIFLPDHLAKSAGLWIGCGVSLSLENDVLTLRSTNEAFLFSPATKKMIWENKLGREFSGGGNSTILSEKDIYMLLLLENWDADLIARLSKKSNLLQTLWERLADDEKLYDFFCDRVQHFMAECAAELSREKVARQKTKSPLQFCVEREHIYK